ncbi:MAG: DUF559 domain-containing protein [Candidatus Cloacimonetes bacterium]|nr:DUF559 domain-containing protein [Candidatus Cloacimonadota bacterium]
MQTITKIVRELRRNSTPEEKILWEKFRAHRFMGLKFKRQEPIIFDYDGKKRFFVADFLCLNNKFIIEVDRKIHDYQKHHDLIRDNILTTLGYRVVRIRNEEVLNNVNIVLIKLKSEFASSIISTDDNKKTSFSCGEGDPQKADRMRQKRII